MLKKGDAGRVSLPQSARKTWTADGGFHTSYMPTATSARCTQVIPVDKCEQEQQWMEISSAGHTASVQQQKEIFERQYTDEGGHTNTIAEVAGPEYGGWPIAERRTRKSSQGRKNSRGGKIRAAVRCIRLKTNSKFAAGVNCGKAFEAFEEPEENWVGCNAIIVKDKFILIIFSSYISMECWLRTRIASRCFSG